MGKALSMSEVNPKKFAVLVQLFGVKSVSTAPERLVLTEIFNRLENH